MAALRRSRARSAGPEGADRERRPQGRGGQPGPRPGRTGAGAGGSVPLDGHQRRGDLRQELHLQPGLPADRRPGQHRVGLRRPARCLLRARPVRPGQAHNRSLAGRRPGRGGGRGSGARHGGGRDHPRLCERLRLRPEPGRRPSLHRPRPAALRRHRAPARPGGPFRCGGFHRRSGAGPGSRRHPQPRRATTHRPL